MNNTYYKASGKFSPLFFLFLILTAIIAIPIVSFAYIYLIYYLPSVYLNVFLAVGCGLLLGLLVNKAAHFGKVRNKTLIIISSVVFVLLAKYVMWLFYIPLVYSKAYEVVDLSFIESLDVSLSLFLTPVDVLEFIQEINEYGVWSLMNADVNGILLYVIWFCELVVIAFGCIFMAKDKAGEPFYEDESKWFKKGSAKVRLNMPDDINLFKTKLESMQSDEILALINSPFTGGKNYLGIEYYYLDGVQNGYMTVKTISRSTDKKGKDTESKVDFIKYIRINSEVINALQNWKSLMPN